MLAPPVKNALTEPLSMEGRAMLLPFRDTVPGSVFNVREWALPGALAAPINAVTSFGRAYRGQLDDPMEEALNVAGALQFGAAGAPMRAGPGTLGMNVYHGGPVKVSSPDFTLSGKVSGIKEEQGVFWVSPSKDLALKAGTAASSKPVLSEFEFKPQNPLQIEYPIRSVFDGSFLQIKADAIKKAKKSGHDAIIFSLKNTGSFGKILDDEIAIINPAALTPK